MLVAIDNMIQAPIAKTGIGATLDNDIVFDVQFTTTGITSIASNDIIKIDNEFMRVTSVTGTGTTMFVERPLLGTQIEPHSAGATIQKFTGNYDISGNTINFVSAPYGNIPLSSTTNAPDDRDYTGITTRSQFSARVFTKRGVISSSNEAYSSNFVFDAGDRWQITAPSTVIGNSSVSFAVNTGIVNSSTALDSNNITEYDGVYPFVDVYLMVQK